MPNVLQSMAVDLDMLQHTALYYKDTAHAMQAFVFILGTGVLHGLKAGWWLNASKSLLTKQGTFSGSLFSGFFFSCSMTNDHSQRGV